MGYVNDTHMSQFIPPFEIAKTAGTWTPTIAANLISDVRTAAGAAFTLIVPLKVPSNASGLKGSYLKSVDLYWLNAGADLTSIATVAIDKVTLPTAQTGTAAAGTTVAVTVTSGNETSAKRVTQATHHMIVTLDTPVWIDDDEAFYLSMVCVDGGGTTFSLYGARANFTLRQ